MENLPNLEDLILEEVKEHQGIPVALSGGIDSSLLAALVKPRFVISVKLPGDNKYNEIYYSTIVAQHLKLEHIVIGLDKSRFKKDVEEAVKAIGRPIPHFNIFPLFTMYRKLYYMEEKELILGDGPDETMAGYARDLIFNYLYKVYEFEAFEDYKGLIDKFLRSRKSVITAVTGKKVDTMMEANIQSRDDMDDMSNKIAEYFGIKNIRPYQDNKILDDFMKNLPDDSKIQNVEYGKYALREIAEKYLPNEIAWRKKKVGGPVYPVNKLMGWDKKEGEFGKKSWMSYQQAILNETLNDTDSIQ